MTTRRPDTDRHGTTAVALRSYEIMATGGRDDFDAVIHPDAVNRESRQEPPAARGRGPSAFHASALWLRSAYADLSWDVHEVVTEGDLVVAHLTMSGRHVGPFVVHDKSGHVERAFAPTGRSFSVHQTHWSRVQDGMVIEHRANRDDLGQSMQLGWIPPSPTYLLRCARATRRARRRSPACHRRVCRTPRRTCGPRSVRLSPRRGPAHPGRRGRRRGRSRRRSGG